MKYDEILRMIYFAFVHSHLSYGIEVRYMPIPPPTTCQNQWRNILTGGPWTNYIKGPIPHFEFTEKFIIIKVLTKITIKHKTMMKCKVKSNFIIKAKLSV